MRIRVSTQCYNEIATALERHGVKADGTTELTLEKGTQLSCPIDFKMVTIRRDIATIAAQVYKQGMYNEQGSAPFIDLCKEMMYWIINEDKSVISDLIVKQPKGWK